MRAAAFITTAQFEGFGVSLVESLGCGTPVIVTDCPCGPAEILDHGTYGELIPVGNADPLGAVLTMTCDNGGRRRRCKPVRPRLRPSIARRPILNLFDRLLGGSRGAEFMPC